MKSITFIGRHNRDVSAKQVDFRLNGSCCEIEYHLIVGDQTLHVSTIELRKLAEIIVSYIEPEKLVISPDYARALQPILQRIIEKDCKMQEILDRHKKRNNHKEH